MHVTAIVVARAGSRRVPNKALRPFGDSTLIGHKVAQLRQCHAIDSVVVGSDSVDVLEEASRHGAETRRRDAYHCDEARCSANEMILNMVAMVETDVVVWAHPTNPLCLPSVYDDAVDWYQRMNEGRGSRHWFDSLASVTRMQRHAWAFSPEADYSSPLNFDPWGERHPLASELTPMFFQDGAIFIQSHDQILRNSYFYGRRPYLYEVDSPFGFDVDTEQDFLIAHALYSEFHTEVLE